MKGAKYVIVSFKQKKGSGHEQNHKERGLISRANLEVCVETMGWIHEETERNVTHHGSCR